MKKELSVDFNLRATWQAISRMYNHYGNPFDISVASGFVLINIDKKNGTPATKIAPLVGLEPRSLSRLLKSLEDRNLIYKRNDAFDKRSVRVFLSEEGQLKRELSKMAIKLFNHKVLESVGEDKYMIFLEVINSIRETIDQPDLFSEIESKASVISKRLDELK